MPNLYIVAGPNGAGKTTFAREFLPHYADCRNFVNADLIAQGVSPFSPESAAFHAGRLMLDEIQQFARRGMDFGFETTLSGQAYLKLFRSLRLRGYKAHLFFLWVQRVEMALERVRGRVRAGGHDIPEAVVRRRFERSIRNFFRKYRALADSWMLFDNSADTPEVIASCNGGMFHIMKKEIYERLSSRYGSQP